ncbi:MAG: hypothetical protein Q4D05_04895 [Acinetobacter sp.]|nr:hypothetical protein [Acinetobacter sp.]
MFAQKSVDDLIKFAYMFHNEAADDAWHRYRSWETCYSQFKAARQAEHKDYKQLSIALGFYLASWGMYRGSAFLLDCNEQVHEAVVKIVLEPKYDALLDLDCETFLQSKHIQMLLQELSERLRQHYDEIRRSVEQRNQKKPAKADVSSVLITKVLLGVLACVPAYDRFFKNAIVGTGISTAVYNTASLKKLAKFYMNHREQLEMARLQLQYAQGQAYPQMKFLDMGFFKMGANQPNSSKSVQ